MGDVFRQKYRDRKGQTRESAKWYGEYRDADDVTRRVPLAKDKAAARAMLRSLEVQAERIKAGLVDPSAAAADDPLADLVAAYLADLRLKGRRPRYVKDVGHTLGAVVAGCGWTRPADLRHGALDAYLGKLEAAGRTKAKHHQAAVAFAGWLHDKGKLPGNPLARATKPRGEATRRRRALSADELRALVAAAAERPLLAERRIDNGPRKGELGAAVKPADEARLRAEGRNNALLYRTAFYTGLRAEELRALQVGDLTLDGPAPGLVLSGRWTKNRKDAPLPLPPALAADLAAWIADRGASDADPVFKVPRHTARMFRLDLAAAGIPYLDARGRVADFHSLRASFATHLSAGGAKAAEAQELLRHSDIRLTLQTYLDDAMNRGREALSRLPEI